MSSTTRPPRDNGMLARKWKKFTQPRVRTRESLPEPPRGMDWEQCEKTLEWKLVPKGGPKTQETSKNKMTMPTTCDKPVPQQAAKKETIEPSDEKIVEALPSGLSEAEEKFDYDDWDLISERISTGSIGGGAVFVMQGGSVRSIGSLGDNNSIANISAPFKVQRTLSSSTIDTIDGDKALGALGVDYVEHIVLPSDTLQGICLAYKISLTRLRQVNQFTGPLSSAPKKLIVPLSKKAIRSGFVQIQDKEGREYKTHAFLAELPSLKETEAIAYLELADWDIQEAVRAAREDNAWKKEDEPDGKTSDIHITVKLQKGVPVDIAATGAGLRPQPKADNNNNKNNDGNNNNNKNKATVFDGVPAIATKSVRPQDVYNVSETWTSSWF